MFVYGMMVCGGTDLFLFRILIISMMKVTRGVVNMMKVMKKMKTVMRVRVRVMTRMRHQRR